MNEAGLHPTPDYEVFPQRFGRADDVFIRTEGPLLHGWWFRSDQPRAVLLILHGNSNNISPFCAYVPEFLKAGYHVLLANYRGFGASQGKADLWSLARDANAMLDWVKSQPHLASFPVGVLGVSLGTSVALSLGAGRPEVGAVVLDCPFLPKRELGRVLGGSFLATLLHPFLVPISLDSPALAARLHKPLLILHGVRDSVIHYDASVQLFDAATEPKFLWLADDAGHSPGVAGAWGEIFQRQIVRFLDTYLLREERAMFRARWRCEPMERGVLVRVEAEPLGKIEGEVPIEICLAFDSLESGERPVWFRAWWPEQKAWEFEVHREPRAVSILAFELAAREGSGWTHVLPNYARSIRALEALKNLPLPSDPATRARAFPAAVEMRIDELVPSSHPLVRPAYIRRYGAAADMYRQRDDRESEIRCLRKALSLVPADPDGILLLLDGRFELSIDLESVAAIHDRLAMLAHDPEERSLQERQAAKLRAESLKRAESRARRMREIRARVEAVASR